MTSYNGSTLLSIPSMSTREQDFYSFVMFQTKFKISLKILITVKHIMTTCICVLKYILYPFENLKKLLANLCLLKVHVTPIYKQK